MATPRHSLRAAIVLTLLLASSPILGDTVTTTTIAEVEKILGLTFTPAQRSQMVELLNDSSYWGNRTAFESMRGYRPGISSAVRNLLAAVVGQSQLVSLNLPDYPYSAMSLIIDAEAAAAFDELTRSGDDALLTAQGKWDWPNLLRTARTIPAAEYLQADRLRRKLIQDMSILMNTVDVWVASDVDDATLFISDLTGQPCVVIPHGGGTSLSFVGRLYDEATILALAKAYQDATLYHLSKPPLFVQ